jgi:hypothetical protein
MENDPQEKRETVKNRIYESYANLAMAHSAVVKKQEKYGPLNYMIRAKLFKGLKDGSMNMRTIFDDEKVKLKTGQRCNYCGVLGKLSLDHIVPKILGGFDEAENLIFACQSCNSSKGKKDLMEWATARNQFLPLMILRRYLKLTFRHCTKHNLLDLNIEDIKDKPLPFRIDLLPISYPSPKNLILNAEDLFDSHRK